MKNSNAELYSMPSIEEDCFEQNKEVILQKTEEIQRRAYEEGFASGEKAGIAEGERKAELLIERLEKTIGELIDVKDSLISGLESDVVELSIAMAQKVIADEIRTRPEVILSVVKEALQKLQSRDTIVIKINPALYDLFMKNKSELLDIHKDISFDVNKNVPLTGPLVISKTEEVVTDIDSLMSNVVRSMKSKKDTAVPEQDNMKQGEVDGKEKEVQDTSLEASGTGESSQE
jgi:flagellar biosynthesis/type III secretory pathway protein FliH